MRQKVTIKIVKLCLLACVSLANAESANEAKPSFDCIKAKSNTEKIICSDEGGELQNLDRYMGEVYTQLIYELKKSSFGDKDKRLKDILQSQRDFIRDREKLFKIDDIKHLYQKRTIALLKDLGVVLDSNNKELCEYARKYEVDWSKWREIPPSIKPPFSIGLCAFARNNRDVFFETFCTENGKIKKDKVAKAIREKSPYTNFPYSHERRMDIDNDGTLEKVIITIGSYFSVLWIYKNGKLDEKASDRIYGDDLHFRGSKTTEGICISSEEACMALTTYALPANKISQRLEFYPADELGFMPILSELSYGVMEFEGKNYITLLNGRFFWDETEKYPNVRIYLLEGDKRELKCTYYNQISDNVEAMKNKVEKQLEAFGDSGANQQLDSLWQGRYTLSREGYIGWIDIMRCEGDLCAFAYESNAGQSVCNISGKIRLIDSANARTTNIISDGEDFSRCEVQITKNAQGITPARDMAIFDFDCYAMCGDNAEFEWGDTYEKDK